MSSSSNVLRNQVCFVCGRKQAFLLHEVDPTPENIRWQKQHMPPGYWDSQGSRWLTVWLCQQCDDIKEGKDEDKEEEDQEELQRALEESAMQEAMALSLGAGSSTDGAMKGGAATDSDIELAMAMSLVEGAATDSEIERAIAASLAGDAAATESEGV